MNLKSHTRILRHIGASEVWIILPALLVIFLAATELYGAQSVLQFLATPHLSSVILLGVAVWLGGMTLQGRWLGQTTEQAGQRPSHLWVPIKGAMLTALLFPVPALDGSILTHFLSAWVRLVG